MTGLTDLPGKIREYGLLIRWFALEVDRVKRRIHDKRCLLEAFEENIIIVKLTRGVGPLKFPLHCQLAFSNCQGLGATFGGS